MNDGFPAQLRRHLQETADDRPADAQLARALHGVATTMQRHPAMARLTWNPGRIGPIPSVAIRYGLIAAALLLATMAGAGLGGGARQPSSVFEGTWITIDPADGSGMTLVVGPGLTPDVYFEDGYATGLACRNDVVKRFTARGTGEISDHRLVVTFPEGGGCGLKTVEVSGRYDYDPRGDTLTDRDGVAWTLALGERPESQAPDTQAPETPAPETPAPETPAAGAPSEPTPDATVALATPEPDPGCIQFDAPGTYTAPVGSLSLTVALPGTVAEPWNGDRDGFNVMRAACTDGSGSGWIDAGEVTLVDTNACAGERVGVRTTAEAIAAVSVAKGIDVVEQADVTLDGYTGTRFVIGIHDMPDACPDLQIPLVDGLNPVDQGMDFRLYLIDVDGTTLALGLYGYADWEPAVRSDVDGIIDSMRVALIQPG